MNKISPIDQKRFIRFLKNCGCEYKRSSGGHMIYAKIGIKRPVVVPIHINELGIDIIKSNLKTLNISHDDYLLMLSD